MTSFELFLFINQLNLNHVKNEAHDSNISVTVAV